MCDAWADEFEAKIATGLTTADAGLARDGIEFFRTLPKTAERSVVLYTDLHASNGVAAGREPWLAIDSSPHVGDSTYDVLQHVLNCEERRQREATDRAVAPAEVNEGEALRAIATVALILPRRFGDGPVAATTAPGSIVDGRRGHRCFR